MYVRLKSYYWKHCTYCVNENVYVKRILSKIEKSRGSPTSKTSGENRNFRWDKLIGQTRILHYISYSTVLKQA